MSVTPSPVLMWFRRDLRLADNPALAEAARSGRPVLAVYVHDEAAAGAWPEGGASRWWLHHSLKALETSLAGIGVRLHLARGETGAVLAGLAAATGAGQVLWNRRTEPWAARQEREVAARLKDAGVETRSFSAALLFEPGDIVSKAGTPFQVFTPFWRACLAAPPPSRPLPPPGAVNGLAGGPDGERLEDWGLLPTAPDWAGGIRAVWSPGEAAAGQRLADFLKDGLAGYAAERDRPDHEGTSRLSPHLHFGEISPRQVFHAAHAAPPGEGSRRFLAELGWREFSAHLLHRHADLPEWPLRPEFARMEWRDDPAGLEAWRRGLTGYPLVDAGMRQLWTTGWMHNRVRMVAASFLVKDLLIHWRDGEAWFWDTLVDADLASNAASWQWVAGCGADAAPFFRVFNPALQGAKFDPRGDYIRRWCPELTRLPDRWLNQPWMAPPLALAEAGVKLGITYPAPVVDHDAARRRALEAFGRLSR